MSSSIRNELTTSEWNALRALEDTPFFAPTATNGVLGVDEFSLLWQGRKAELDAERLQPYSDILYEDIRHELMGMKAELSAALKAKIMTATHPRDIAVEFKSFFSAYEPSWPRYDYEGSATWNAMVEFGREEYVRAQTIIDSELDARIGVMRDESEEDCGCHRWPFYGCRSDSDHEADITPIVHAPATVRNSWILPPERTYNIVKKTDLLQRVGALFGPNFYVSLKSESEERTISGRVYPIYRNTFVLHYMPQPPPHRKKTLAATLVKYATHENFQLTSRDTVVGLLGERVSHADA
jgi:hypothetical protein